MEYVPPHFTASYNSTQTFNGPRAFLPKVLRKPARYTSYCLTRSYCTTLRTPGLLGAPTTTLPSCMSLPGSEGEGMRGKPPPTPIKRCIYSLGIFDMKVARASEPKIYLVTARNDGVMAVDGSISLYIVISAIFGWKEKYAPDQASPLLPQARSV